MSKIYTGVGGRDAPIGVLKHMNRLAKELGIAGYTLRSGGATGSDLAFENGCDAVDGLKEIYLPVLGFNGSTSSLIPNSEAFKIAESIHPAWHLCSSFAKKAHARNVHQVLGVDLKTPSDFLVCWTRGGKATGGTATAINLAEMKGVPVYNLFDELIKIGDLMP